MDLAPLENLPLALAQLSAEGELAGANAAFLRLFGLPQSELAKWRGIQPRESIASLQAALASGKPFSIEIQASCASGAAWLECAGSFDERKACLCIFQDITASRTQAAAAEAQSAQFRLLADNLPVQIAYYEVETFHCLFANHAYAKANGMEPHQVVGKTFGQIIGESAERFIQPMVDRVINERVTVTYDRPSTGPDGKQRWLEVSLIPHMEPGKRPFAAFVLISDISKHRLAEIEISENQARLDTFMNASAEGIVFHQGGIIIDVNPALCRILGSRAEDVIGRNIIEFIPPENRAEIFANVTAAGDSTYESAIRGGDGATIPVEFIGRSLNYKGKLTRMAIVRDLRDRKAAQERIAYLAQHDVLTGLPNRTRLTALTDLVIDSAQKRGQNAALFFVDLDHFKRINDSLGHAAGDELLRTTGQRMRSLLRDQDVLGRFASDEFVMTLPGIEDARAAHEFADRLLAKLQQPMQFEGRQLQISPSIGIAMYPADGASADELLLHADTAMYAAKQAGRSTYRFFSRELSERAAKHFELEYELELALERNEFVLHFQPIYATDSQEITNLEALIRWQHPKRGLIGPNYFIEFAEERRMIVRIGEWVMKEAARWAERWLAAGLRSVPIAVNLSSSQFRDQSFLPSLERFLQSTPLPRGWLELELTERMLMDDIEEIRQRLNQIKVLGIALAVDDFGTGYSSLVHLKALPIDKLKIDRSFIKDLPGDANSRAITTAIVQMSLSLGLDVVAEGVETRAQFEMLTQLGCAAIQGFLLSKPVPGERVEQLLAAGHAKAA
jgi:diguanylate cyclase (GGDEF)-like protein/PAS domain S-box-containing protein